MWLTLFAEPHSIASLMLNIRYQRVQGPWYTIRLSQLQKGITLSQWQLAGDPPPWKQSDYSRPGNWNSPAGPVKTEMFHQGYDWEVIGLWLPTPVLAYPFPSHCFSSLDYHHLMQVLVSVPCCQLINCCKVKCLTNFTLVNAGKGWLIMKKKIGKPIPITFMNIICNV